jgi:chromosome partitioning protein
MTAAPRCLAHARERLVLHLTLTGTLADDAVEAIGVYGVPVCPVRIGHRSVFIHSLTEGLTALEYEPEGKGASEIRRFYKWACRQVGL